MAKNKVGRPLIFGTPKDLQKAIDIYFAECKKAKEKPCIAGLADACGVDRGTIYNYSEKDEFFNTIKKARNYIISQWESKLVNSGGNVAGLIFIAKNYGYTDKQDITHTIKDYSKASKKLRDLL